MEYYTVQIPKDAEADFLASLFNVPGVVVGNTHTKKVAEREWLTLRQFAEFAGVNYFTARDWVVVQKRLPYSRPSGKLQGGIRIALSEARTFLAGKKKRGRR